MVGVETGSEGDGGVGSQCGVGGKAILYNKEGEDDEGAIVTGDMFVSLVAKCPIQGGYWVNSNS